MQVTFEKLHPHFAAEVGPIDLRRVHDPETLAEIRAGMACVDAEMATHPPSFVAYTLRGDCDSVALPERRRTRRVSLWMAASGPRIEKMESRRLRSITWPRPPSLSAWRTAITVAIAP